MCGPRSHGSQTSGRQLAFLQQGLAPQQREQREPHLDPGRPAAEQHHAGTAEQRPGIDRVTHTRVHARRPQLGGGRRQWRSGQPAPRRRPPASANTAAIAIISAAAATSQADTGRARSPGNHTNPASTTNCRATTDQAVTCPIRGYVLSPSSDVVPDEGEYPLGGRVSDKQIRAVSLTQHQFHGKWNYTVHSGPALSIPLNKTFNLKTTS